MKYIQGIIALLSLLFIWQGIVSFFQLPIYILPTPLDVFLSAYTHAGLILAETKITVIETLLGFILGILLGMIAALSMAFCRLISLWLLPILIISQAIPTFAIAPLLVIWFGFGMASKIITTMIMLFFPVASAFYDGLHHINSEWVELANIMNAKKWRLFWFIKIRAALPHLASGIRVAAVFAPMGAVIGEWVGASQGLGFLMLNANERMQIDLMFAGLFSLIIFSLVLYFITNYLLDLFIPWQNHKKMIR